MRLSNNQVVKGIYGKACGQLLWIHKIDVDVVCHDMRCVELPGTVNGGEPVTFLRVFSLKEAEGKGVAVAGWQTFDRHPDLILFEGYVTKEDEAHLVRRAA